MLTRLRLIARLVWLLLDPALSANFIDALKLGRAMQRLEADEASGRRFCLHSSWPAPGARFWICIRGEGKRRLSPVAAPSLLEALDKAVRLPIHAMDLAYHRPRNDRPAVNPTKEPPRW